MRKPVFGFNTRSDTNRAVQPQKMAEGLKFRIKEVVGLYYPVTAKLICVFVFAYAKSRFSYNEVHIVKLGFTGVYNNFLFLL